MNAFNAFPLRASTMNMCVTWLPRILAGVFERASTQGRLHSAVSAHLHSIYRPNHHNVRRSTSNPFSTCVRSHSDSGRRENFQNWPKHWFTSSGTWLTLLSLQRSASLKIDWTRLGAQLGLRGNTANSLVAFKKRNDDARRKLQALSEQPQEVDFAYYRSVLKNTAIVDQIEKDFKAFKPATYDVNRQIKAIDAFQAQAVKSAEETAGKVEEELKALQKTLKNIEEARPFEDLTVVRTAWGFGGIGTAGLFWDIMANEVLLSRTRLLLPAPTSTSAPSSSLARASGTFPATRSGFLLYPCFWRLLTPS